MKPTFSPTQTHINAALAELFTASECWGGYLEMQPTPEEVLYSARGYHQSGKEINVYPILPPLKALLSQYATETPGGIDFLTIFVNLRQSLFTYQPTSVTAVAEATAAEATAQAERNRAYREQLRQQLSPVLFGPDLATQVAEALAQGRPFNFGHPAYCGMGLDVVDGHYRYGSVWEGDLESELIFPNQPAFVTWLAQQSDLSLALLEFEDPLVWNNQTVTRARLLELVNASTTL